MNKGFHTPFWELLEKLDKKTHDELIQFHEGFMAACHCEETVREEKEKDENSSGREG